MDNHIQDEATIREYLLGRLDGESELVEQLEDHMFLDTRFSEMVEAIEDEIIEEYLDDTLNPADRQAVERHFLRPPERQRKLQDARLLYRGLRTAGRDAEASIHGASVRLPLDIPPPVRVRPPFRSYLEIAAGVLLAASLTYVVRLRVETQEINRKAEQSDEHSAVLTRQLQEARELAQPATIMLSLFQSGLRRGEPLRELIIGPGTRTVRVDIALPSSEAGSFEVRLESAGKNLWSKPHVQAYTSSKGAILLFDLPVHDLASGEYSFVVESEAKHDGRLSYLFLIRNLPR